VTRFFEGRENVTDEDIRTASNEQNWSKHCKSSYITPNAHINIMNLHILVLYHFYSVYLILSFLTINRSHDTCLSLTKICTFTMY
jgi:hypothetical protein